MPAGKRDRGYTEVEMSNLSCKSELTINTEKAQAIFCKGLDKLNEYIAQANDSADEYTRRKKSYRLGQHLFQHASANHYFDLGTYNGAFKISFAPKKFLLSCDIESARSQFYSLRGLVLRFIEKRQSAVGLEAKDSIEESKEEVAERVRLESEISVEAALTEAGLYGVSLAPQPKIPADPDLINPWPDLQLPSHEGKNIIFDSKWHLRRSVSPWLLFGARKAQEVQGELDQLRMHITDEARRAQVGRKDRLERTLDTLLRVSDRLLTHRKAVMTGHGKKKAALTGPDVPNTRSGVVFLKCLLKEHNHYFVQLMLKDLMRLHVRVISKSNRQDDYQSQRSLSIRVLTGDERHTYYHKATRILEEPPRPDENESMELFLDVLRVWVMCRFGQNYNTFSKEGGYIEQSNNFFNGTAEKRQYERLVVSPEAEQLISS